jgi:hypothetical protein
MGYTRYWERTDKPMDESFVRFCNAIFDNCKKLGIKICGWDGTGEPTVTDKAIMFNGNARCNLDHESFILNDQIGFCFCKTAKKPYDYAVRTILREAFIRGYIKDLEDDGLYEDIVSDEEYLTHH